MKTPISALQEMMLTIVPTPDYKWIAETSSGENITFVFECVVLGTSVTGKGRNKQEAKQEAARKMLLHLRDRCGYKLESNIVGIDTPSPLNKPASFTEGDKLPTTICCDYRNKAATAYDFKSRSQEADMVLQGLIKKEKDGQVSSESQNPEFTEGDKLPTTICCDYRNKAATAYDFKSRSQEADMALQGLIKKEKDGQVSSESQNPEFTEGDKLPTTICCDYKNKAATAYDFKSRSQEADMALQGLIKKEKDGQVSSESQNPEFTEGDKLPTTICCDYRNKAATAYDFKSRSQEADMALQGLIKKEKDGQVSSESQNPEFTEGDKLPTTICCDYRNKAATAYDFKSRSQEADMPLQGLIKKEKDGHVSSESQKPEGDVSVKIENLADNEEQSQSNSNGHFDEDDMECLVEPQLGLEDKDSLQELNIIKKGVQRKHKPDIGKNNNDTGRKINCPLCNTSYADSGALTKHMWHSHADIMGPKKRRRPKKIQTNVMPSSSNYISMVKEKCEKNHWDRVYYDVVSATGPAHQPSFVVQARFGLVTRHAVASSIKKARHLAAKEMFTYLSY